MKGEFIMFNKIKEGFFLGIGAIFGGAIIKMIADQITDTVDGKDEKDSEK